MALSHDLISQFAKIVNADKKQNVESTIYGTVVDQHGRKPGDVDDNGNKVVIDESGGKYIKPDGSDQLIPISENDEDPSKAVAGSTTVNTEYGDRASVLIKNHTATVTGNISSPSASNKDIDNKINEYDIIIAKQMQADKAYFESLTADKASIGELKAAEAKITNLEADKASVKDLNAANAEIDNLKATKIDADIVEATYATIESLKATDAKIGSLDADIADINTLMFGSATGNVLQTTFANAVIALLGDAQIKSAMIESLNADKINAGSINTSNVKMESEDGRLVISDNTIQISDDKRVRVQIGKDASGDYSINLWDTEGNLMLSEGGITDSAIKEAIIRNDMISDDANINAKKLDISSLFTEINNSTETIKSTKVYFDSQKQTLDVAFNEMNTTVTEQGEAIKSQGTELSVIQGKIESKVWQQDIDTATDILSTQYSTLEQTVDGMSFTVASHTSDLNGLETALAETDAKAENALAKPIIEGNSTPVIKVTNAFENSIDNLKFYGKTTQKSFSGKNFYADGDISVYETKHRMALSAPIPAGTYTVSVEFENDSTSYTSGLIFFLYANGTNFNASFAKGGRASRTVTFTDTVTQLSFYAANNATASVGVTASYTRIQIELGSTATEYEPYVGGVPSPNPDYPQSLDSIGMDGSIDYRVCGKNLIPFPYINTDKTYKGITFTVQDDGGIKVVGTATGDVFFELCHIHFSDSDLRAHVASKKTDGNVVISGGDNSVRVYYDSNNSTTYLYIPTGNTINTVVYPQVELGTTATEYEPYVGSQILSIATPDGLRGIPVSSGGTRTDANGQHWICDEIDLKRGVYIQRIGSVDLGTLTYGQSTTSTEGQYRFAASPLRNEILSTVKVAPNNVKAAILSNGFVVSTASDLYSGSYGIAVGKDGDVYIRAEQINDLTTAEVKAAVSGFVFYYELAEPIETLLDEETLATFASITNELGSVTVISETDVDVELSELVSNKQVTNKLDTAVKSLNKTITENVTALEANANSITASVTSIETRTNSRIDDLEDSVDKIRKDVALKVTDENVQISIQKAISDGVTRVDTGTGITFDEKGMTVDKIDGEGNSVSPTSTNINENGMVINDNGTGDDVLTANKDGVRAKDLEATTYLVVGGRSRFENYGSNRTACFWIGE